MQVFHILVKDQFLTVKNVYKRLHDSGNTIMFLERHYCVTKKGAVEVEYARITYKRRSFVYGHSC